MRCLHRALAEPFVLPHLHSVCNVLCCGPLPLPRTSLSVAFITLSRSHCPSPSSLRGPFLHGFLNWCATLFHDSSSVRPNTPRNVDSYGRSVQLRIHRISFPLSTYSNYGIRLYALHEDLSCLLWLESFRRLHFDRTSIAQTNIQMDGQAVRTSVSRCCQLTQSHRVPIVKNCASRRRLREPTQIDRLSLLL